MTTPPDPLALLRSRAYVRLLVVAAILGVPVSAAAYGFLALVNYLQEEIFTHLPHGLGFATEPLWWPLPVLAVGGVLAALGDPLPARPGRPVPGGRVQAARSSAPAELPGVIFAALATLVFGAVLGPEMPLILIGGGLVLILRAARRQVPDQARSVLASSGSFASISTLFGSPILGAFLLMEASGLAGAMMGVVLLPGLLAAGIGSLIFVGLDNWTGLGTFSLAIPGLPPFSQPTWASSAGPYHWVAAALLGTGIRWLGSALAPYAERWILLAVWLAAWPWPAGIFRRTHRPAPPMCCSGQSAPSPVQHAPATPWGVVMLLAQGPAWGVAEQFCGPVSAMSARRAASLCRTCPGCR